MSPPPGRVTDAVLRSPVRALTAVTVMLAADRFAAFPLRHPQVSSGAMTPATSRCGQSVAPACGYVPGPKGVLPGLKPVAPTLALQAKTAAPGRAPSLRRPVPVATPVPAGQAPGTLCALPQEGAPRFLRPRPRPAPTQLLQYCRHLGPALVRAPQVSGHPLPGVRPQRLFPDKDTSSRLCP